MAKSSVAPIGAAAPYRPPRPAWVLGLLLAMATFALYWPALQNGFVNYDDDRYVTANPQVQRGLTVENFKWAFLNPVADNWHPLTVLSHMLVCQFGGLNPQWHHLGNTLLHAANAALVFLLLKRLTGSLWRSFFVAALFAMHPLRVESVAWVAERKDVLSGFFGLLTLIFYARYGQTSSRRAYWLAAGCLALGLMSKPMLVTWPFVLLLLDYWPLRRLPARAATGETLAPWRKLIVEKIPFFALAAAASVAAFLVQQHGGAVQTAENLPLGARAGNALVAYCRYLEKTVWPADLAVLYPHPGYWPWIDVLLAGAFLIGITALCLRFHQRPYLLVGWLWFVGTLVPVIGLVQVGQQSMADRYTYLPSLGIFIAAVYGATDLIQASRLRLRLLAATGILLVVACGIGTWHQLAFWKDGETLFRHAYTVTRENFTALYNLGEALDEKHEAAQATEVYRQLLALKPGDTKAHANLGLDLDSLGDRDEAYQEEKTAVEQEPTNASYHNNLAITLFKLGHIDEAATEFAESLRLAPNAASTHNNYAAALYQQGKPEEALHEFEAAVALKPDYVEAHLNLAKLLAKNGRVSEAISHYQVVLQMDPSNGEARARLAELQGATP